MEYDLASGAGRIVGTGIGPPTPPAILGVSENWATRGPRAASRTQSDDVCFT